MNPLRKLAGQAAIYGLSSIIGRLLNYLLVPLYTRVLVPSEYGVVTEIYAYVSILWIILTYGMETTFFRFSESEKDKKLVYHTSILSLLFTSLIFALLVLINLQAIAQWMGYGNHKVWIIWFTIILVLDAITTIPFAKLRQENKALRFAIIKLISIGSYIGLNLFLVLLCPYILKYHPSGFLAGLLSLFFNADDLVSYIIISNLISSVVTLVFLFPDIPLRAIRFSKQLWLRMMNYTWPLLVVSVAGSINLSLDKILLPRLLPEGTDAMSQVGIYGACYKISIIMSLFVQTFRYAADPFFFSESGKEDSRRLYADVLNFFTIAMSLLFLVTMMYIDVVIRFIGSDYREGAGVIPVLLLGNLFLGIYYSLSIWYKLTNQTIFGALISAIGALTSIVLNVLLIPFFGYYGSAWAAFMAYLVMMVTSYFQGQRHFPVPYNLRKILFYMGLAVVLYLVTIFISYPTMMIKLISNSILVFIYLAVIYSNEKETLKEILRRTP